MVNLEFCEKHNMVAFLKKPNGSEGFHEIVDFLNGSHIRHAFTKNPTIYVSLIKQFWHTATVKAIDKGEQQIIATVDGKEFAITEASVRRHLQLADADGIRERTPLFPTMLAIQTEEGEGSGHPSEPLPPPSFTQHIQEEQILTIVLSTHQKTQTPRQALNEDTKLPQTSVPIPNVPDEAVYDEWDDSVERATTTAASLDAAQDSAPGAKKSQGVPLLRVDRVLALETDLRQTKKVYGTAYTKLILKVKKLEKTVKSNQARRRPKIVVSDDEEDSEDSSKQGRMIEDIDQDARITLVTPTKVNTYTRRRRAVSTGSKGVSTASRIFSTAAESVSTAGESMPVSTADVVQEGVKDKGKAIMQESEQPKKIKKRVQIQMSLDEELAQKLYEEEQARFNAEQEAKFNAEKEELLARETNEDEANPSVTDTEDGSESTEEPKADEISQDDLQQMMMIVPVEEVYVKALQVKYPIIDWEDFVKERFSTTEPTDDKEKALWVELKRLFEPDNDDILWKLQRQNNPAEQVYLFEGDIYDDPSLLRFYQNDDTPPLGNNKRKEKVENGPEWVVRSKFKGELANFMLEKKSHTKGIREMLDQHLKEIHEQFSQILSAIRESKTPKPESPNFAITTRSRVSTRDPLFLTLSKPTLANTEGATKKEGPDSAKLSITHNEEPVPRPSIFYQPSKLSNMPFPSIVKKHKKDDEDERLLSIFKQIHVNLPFLKAMIHMQKGAKSQELKTISYHKLYDILKQHQNEVNEIRAKRLARTANPLALVAQQQPVYQTQNHPTYYAQNSLTRSQQAATRNRGKAIDNEIDKLMALDSLSFKKIYKPTNNNLRTSSNTSRANQDNSPRINRGTGYDNQRIVNVVRARENVGTPVVQQLGIQCYNCKEYGHVARECQKPKRAKDAAYHKEKMLLSHYMYMAQIQEVTPYATDNSRPIFDSESLQKVPNNDNYNVFSIESEHPEQSKSVNDTYPVEQDTYNVIIDSLDMSYDREQIDQDDDDDADLANECDLLASLIGKLKCEIDDSKNRNKFLKTSNKDSVDKLKGEIEDFKTKNKSLESSNNHFKEANNELSKINQLMFKDLKKFQAELDRFHDVKYASKVEIDCAKAKGDLMSYKLESEKSFNEYTRKINNLNQTISEMKKELFAHQETISIMTQQK
nr:ribonuclease H-like domain-containing protein [Tanacetum cinerariifolium]GEY35490.1 ribonuclease H-like domain-containing protein [Tanacetum cinerariifolium]